jgi:hypothetical protein
VFEGTQLEGLLGTGAWSEFSFEQHLFLLQLNSFDLALLLFAGVLALRLSASAQACSEALPCPLFPLRVLPHGEVSHSFLPLTAL